MTTPSHLFLEPKDLESVFSGFMNFSFIPKTDNRGKKTILLTFKAVLPPTLLFRKVSALEYPGGAGHI